MLIHYYLKFAIFFRTKAFVFHLYKEKLYLPQSYEHQCVDTGFIVQLQPAENSPCVNCVTVCIVFTKYQGHCGMQPFSKVGNRHDLGLLNTYDYCA